MRTNIQEGQGMFRLRKGKIYVNLSIQPDSIADDIWRESVALVSIHGLIIRSDRLTCQYHLEGKYKFTGSTITEGFWQYSFNAAYPQSEGERKH